MELLTFEQIIKLVDSDYEKLIELVNEQLNKRVTPPSKPFLWRPFLWNRHTSENVLRYAQELKEYEVKLIDYENEKSILIKQQNGLKIDYKEFLCESFLTNIDRKYWDKVYDYCKGNSEYYNLINKLEELNDLFE